MHNGFLISMELILLPYEVKFAILATLLTKIMMPSPSSIDVDKCKISPIYISVHLFWGISVDFNSLFLKLKSLFSYWKVRQALPIFLHVPTYPINEKSSSFRCDLLTSFINLQNKVSRANHSQFYF